MLIDNVTIRVKAGDGGRGAVAFSKNKMTLGPVGGNGGNGGDVYFAGVSDLGALSRFRNTKEAKTENGENARGNFVDGKSSPDVVIGVPVGTVITNLETGEIVEVVKTTDKFLAAKGGRGGKGNYQFRSSLNTSPRRFQLGKPGQAFTIKLELKLIADVGLVGLPNVGKTSLLNELTAAKSQVANYPFTTLEPNLGTYYGLILADIPGLIEGASRGRGLGVKFLQHIERTKILFHLVSAESDDPAGDYRIVRRELEQYNGALAVKTEYLFLSKYDTVSNGELEKKLNILRKINKEVMPLSVHDETSMRKVQTILNDINKTR